MATFDNEATSHIRRIVTFPRQLTQAQVSAIERYGIDHALSRFS